MKNTKNSSKDPVYNISDLEQLDEIAKITRALSVKERLKILYLIQNKPMTIKELIQNLNLPFSSITQHTNVLCEANLITIEHKPNQKGYVKLCSKTLNSLKILFDDWVSPNDVEETLYEMPIGNFSDLNIIPPCGMTGIHSPIGDFDILSSFYHPNRHKAELLWFSSGSISYRFPAVEQSKDIETLIFSLEICSEAQYFRNDWPSDITFWVNGHELLTWTSPGDFGGRRGKFTPEYWFINSTQYGLLKTIKIDKNGVYLDDSLINTNIKIHDVNIQNKDFIQFSIGIKQDAIHKGGINIFGKNFGDHKQHIIMKVYTKNKI